MTAFSRAIQAFLFVCALGFFCAWIGGIQPFTFEAGTAALSTIVLALAAALFFLTDPPGDHK